MTNAMENHHCSREKHHYFYGHLQHIKQFNYYFYGMFNSKLFVITRGFNQTTDTDDVVAIKGFSDYTGTGVPVHR